MRILSFLICLPLSIFLVFGYLNALLGVGGSDESQQATVATGATTKPVARVSAEDLKALIAQKSKVSGEVTDDNEIPNKKSASRETGSRDTQSSDRAQSPSPEPVAHPPATSDEGPTAISRDAEVAAIRSAGVVAADTAASRASASAQGEVWGTGSNLVGWIGPFGQAVSFSQNDGSTSTDGSRPVWSIEVAAREDQLRRTEDLRLALVRLQPEPLVVIPIRRNDINLGEGLSWSRFVEEEPQFGTGQYIPLPSTWLLSWQPELQRRGGRWHMVLLIGTESYLAWRTQLDRELNRRGLDLRDTASILSRLTVEGNVRHTITQVIPKKAATEGR